MWARFLPEWRDRRGHHAPGRILRWLQLTATAPAYDFLDNLSAATIGTTYQGVDGALDFGATAVVQPTVVGGVSLPSIYMSPPYWNGRTGTETFVEWSLPVPAASAFTFSVGIADYGTCTDGVTFRVVVDGASLWQQNVKLGAWVNGSVDLTAFGGSTARLRIVTNPGPANDPSCDDAAFSNLAFSPLNTVTTTVPMVLSSNAVISGLSGSGTYSANGSSGTVAGVPLPGEFVLFTAPGSSVSAGSNLSKLPFLNYYGADGVLTVAGTFGNSGSVGTITSQAQGAVSRQNGIFAPTPQNGRTILSWTLALPSTTNLQLGWSTGMEDGSSSATGVQFSVRINGATYWTMFQQKPVGWLPASLDLTNWRGQNIFVAAGDAIRSSR